MSEQNLALFKAYHRALAALDFESVAECFAEDAVYVSAGVGGELRGRGNIIAAFKTYFALHRDQKNIESNIACDGENSVKSDWALEAVNATTGEIIHRSGRQEITVAAGKISRIEIWG